MHASVYKQSVRGQLQNSVKVQKRLRKNRKFAVCTLPADIFALTTWTIDFKDDFCLSILHDKMWSAHSAYVQAYNKRHDTQNLLNVNVLIFMLSINKKNTFKFASIITVWLCDVMVSASDSRSRGCSTGKRTLAPLLYCGCSFGSRPFSLSGNFFLSFVLHAQPLDCLITSEM